MIGAFARYFVLSLLTLCLFPSAGRAAGLFDGLGSGSAAKPGPGKEVRVLDSQVGGRGYYTVYLPSDYEKRGSFPIIFNYHGQFENPSAEPFRKLTGGRGYVIVGMEYQPPAAPAPGSGAPVEDPRTPEVNVLRRIAAGLRAELKVDPKLAYVAGFGLGAQEAQAVATRSAELWAGMILLGAGSPADTPPSADFAGKAILVAAGASDSDYAAARQVADAYKKHGAAVTFETFAGKGHVVDVGDTVVQQWLVANGPARQVRVALAAGQAAQKAGRLGEAFSDFDSVAALNADAADGQTAHDAAQAISDKASSLLAAGRRALAAHELLSAAQTLTEVKTAYDGSHFGADAAADLKIMSADPAGAAAIAQVALDRQADAIEAKADAQQRATQFAEAIATYQFYLAKFPTAGRTAAVQAKLKALQSNPAIQAGIQAAHADTDCHSWLSLADSFIRSGLPDKARPYLQRIIDTYGATPWADKARDRLKQLDGGS